MILCGQHWDRLSKTGTVSSVASFCETNGDVVTSVASNTTPIAGNETMPSFVNKRARVHCTGKCL